MAAVAARRAGRHAVFEVRHWPWERIGAGLAALTLLVFAVPVIRQGLPQRPPAEAAARADVPAGQSDDGEALPARHPWLKPVGLAPGTLRPADSAPATPQDDAAEPLALRPPGPGGVAAAASAPPSARAGQPAAVEPLEMRRNCAWGVPGRNPYRGTVEQALLHARLPADVVTEVARRVAAGERSDRVEITRAGIRPTRLDRDFDPQQMAMSFGRTMCLNTRVNFAPGHHEGADLYEVADSAGRRHAVMVPDVCGNVTVLGERGEKRRALAAGAAADGQWWLLATGAWSDEEHAVPEPAGWAGVLLALAMLGATRRRRS